MKYEIAPDSSLRGPAMFPRTRTLGIRSLTFISFYQHVRICEGYDAMLTQFIWQVIRTASWGRV